MKKYRMFVKKRCTAFFRSSTSVEPRTEVEIMNKPTHMDYIRHSTYREPYGTFNLHVNKTATLLFTNILYFFINILYSFSLCTNIIWHMHDAKCEDRVHSSIVGDDLRQCYDMCVDARSEQPTSICVDTVEP